MDFLGVLHIAKNISWVVYITHANQRSNLLTYVHEDQAQTLDPSLHLNIALRTKVISWVPYAYYINNSCGHYHTHGLPYCCHVLLGCLYNKQPNLALEKARLNRINKIIQNHHLLVGRQPHESIPLAKIHIVQHVMQQ